MGNTHIKTGESYKSYKDQIRALDLIVFAGSDAVSSLIKFIEKKNLDVGVDLPVISESEFGAPKLASLRNTSASSAVSNSQSEISIVVDRRDSVISRKDSINHAQVIKKKHNTIKEQAWSHVGLAVTSELLVHPAIKKGKVYVLESTMSGKLGSGIKNIDNTWALGVQIRCLDDLIEAYDESVNSAVGVAKLINNPLDGSARDEIISKFADIYANLNNTGYDSNCISLLSAAFPPLRPLRSCISFAHPPHWMFCSELVATINIKLGVFGNNVRPENVIPMDLLGFDVDSVQDGGVPCVYGGVVQLLSTKWAAILADAVLAKK